MLSVISYAECRCAECCASLVKRDTKLSTVEKAETHVLQLQFSVNLCKNRYKFTFIHLKAVKGQVNW